VILQTTSPRTFQQFIEDQQAFVMKKRENAIRLIEEQERKYQSMFKPNSTV